MQTRGGLSDATGHRLWRSERLKNHNKRVAFGQARKELATARTAEQNISVDADRNDKMAATSAKDVETAKKTAECVWVVEHATLGKKVCCEAGGVTRFGGSSVLPWGASWLIASVGESFEMLSVMVIGSLVVRRSDQALCGLQVLRLSPPLRGEV